MDSAERVDPDGQRFRRRSPAAASRFEPWKRHIIRQLKSRDLAQKIRFQDLILSYLNLLERNTHNVLITRGLLSPPRPQLLSLEHLSSLRTATVATVSLLTK